MAEREVKNIVVIIQCGHFLSLNLFLPIYKDSITYFIRVVPKYLCIH